LRKKGSERKGLREEDRFFIIVIVLFSSSAAAQAKVEEWLLNAVDAPSLFIGFRAVTPQA